MSASCLAQLCSAPPAAPHPHPPTNHFVCVSLQQPHRLELLCQHVDKRVVVGEADECCLDLVTHHVGAESTNGGLGRAATAADARQRGGLGSPAGGGGRGVCDVGDNMCVS